MKCSAPCKIILFGEHAVVYDKLGIAAAIDEKTFVEVSEGDEGIEIVWRGESLRISETELFNKLNLFRQFYKNRDFEKLQSFSYYDSLIVVIAECMSRFGYRNLKIEINFDKLLKGIGRSSSVYVAMSLAISNFLGHNLSVEETSEIAYLGDIIVHAGTPSGIDTNTVTMGGYLSYRKSTGINKLKIGYKLPLIVVDSGESSQTGTTIKLVKRLKEEKPKYTDQILNEIDLISSGIVESLQNQNLEQIGKLMYRNHELLRKLGVSTDRLDSIVKIGMENGALGGKLTAGGGGGCAIILTRNEQEALNLVGKFNELGYNALYTLIGVEGARIE
ncbi:MAG: mevalonate kinase [Candidatus Micrarchaeota archaeon]|nr:mevalonate kinase [Candidatus Micrarchaeota archaeon]